MTILSNADEFINNKKLFTSLKNNFLNHKLSHSLLIYGEKGIGKSTFVKYFINKMFNNFFEEEGEINVSQHTTLIANNSHPNFIVISRLFDEKNKKLTNKITVDQIRKLESFIYQSSLLKLPKIILIDSADDLNKSSSNALLKILEEPKNNTYFFLLSNQLSILLPTIISRCIKFKFNKPSYDEFKKIILLNNININEESEIEYLFDLSNGSPGIALQLSLENISEPFEKFLEILNERKKLSDNILKFSLELSKFNNDQYLTFLSIVRFTLLNIIKINLGINIKNKICSRIFNNFDVLSEHINTSACYRALDYLNKNENNLFVLNLDKKLFTLNLFSEIAVK